MADSLPIREQGMLGHAHLGGAAPIVANMIHERFGYPFHWAVANYLQRSARHIAFAIDVEQAYELGVAAVELALEGYNAVMPAIERLSDEPYRYRIGVADLKDVANVEKFMPKSFISDDGYGITDECRRYLLSQVQGQDCPPYRKGLPEYATLRNRLMSQKLESFYRKI